MRMEERGLVLPVLPVLSVKLGFWKKSGRHVPTFQVFGLESLVKMTRYRNACWDVCLKLLRAHVIQACSPSLAPPNTRGFDARIQCVEGCGRILRIIGGQQCWICGQSTGDILLCATTSRRCKDPMTSVLCAADAALHSKY